LRARASYLSQCAFCLLWVPLLAVCLRFACLQVCLCSLSCSSSLLLPFFAWQCKLPALCRPKFVHLSLSLLAMGKGPFLGVSSMPIALLGSLLAAQLLLISDGNSDSLFKQAFPSVLVN